ncbi:MULTISPECIES: ABC transporter substrate-binding protein [Pseudoalteromonas]|uniref:ABC-type uncharacterized transport system, periplasmic component n=1 Tax=Pseudoalteromonas luteoviolacea (strain 2ta16) TaxID=1353533 RepID=V4HIQ8_PSEL2|nr:ABC transporter substrate binding protein [Pseudoalteromonas luteoviolacea]ESP90695.1 ABC-type uncharacterized transport system, periplasmic component [Pseudoalteromonas luteoviolacea 2ta16]MCG7548110.1 hypothetical protein [Pseudoalteromonas sp. Of7M-16]
MIIGRFLLMCLLAFALNAEARKILIVETLQVPIVTTHTKQVITHLQRLDNQLEIEVFDGKGQSAIIAAHIQEKLACRCFDLLIANGTLAAKIGKKLLANQGIPMVFVTVADPEGAGLTMGDNSSSHFITGRAYSVRRGTKLEIVNQLFKNDKVNIGIVATTYPAALTDIRRIEVIAKQYKNIQLTKKVIEYQDVSNASLDDTYLAAYQAASAIQSQVDFFWSVNGPLSEKSEFVPAMSILKPILYGANIRSVQQGALFTVIPDPEWTGKEIAKIVVKILSGTPASKIEIRSASKNILAFNVKTATSLGVVIPFSLLKIAGEHVYH